jgi:hypothetical protein
MQRRSERLAGTRCNAIKSHAWLIQYDTLFLVTPSAECWPTNPVCGVVPQSTSTSSRALIHDSPRIWTMRLRPHTAGIGPGSIGLSHATRWWKPRKQVVITDSAVHGTEFGIVGYLRESCGSKPAHRPSLFDINDEQDVLDLFRRGLSSSLLMMFNLPTIIFLIHGHQNVYHSCQGSIMVELCSCIYAQNDFLSSSTPSSSSLQTVTNGLCLFV